MDRVIEVDPTIDKATMRWRDAELYTRWLLARDIVRPTKTGRRHRLPRSLEPTLEPPGRQGG